ncbi:hypothetical protein BVRB_7g174400 [Beta vulgaris subsp. vulgaris]|nr:hypothetical protein BVRB_7g174400 [Beta vulgaris subsp. vulgaris]
MSLLRVILFSVGRNILLYFFCVVYAENFYLRAAASCSGLWAMTKAFNFLHLILSPRLLQ